MFQTFEPVSDRSFAGKHLPLLRAEMKKQNLDGFLIPHDDEYQNEYIPAYAERLMWSTGFSGSAGAALIMLDKAIMFTDGRYTLQVRAQADSAFFDYVDLMETPPDAWLSENAPKGARIGYDPMLHTTAGVNKLKTAAQKAGFELIAVVQNPVDAAWKDQPPAPLTPVKPHDLQFAGKSSEDKRKEIAAAVAKAGADMALITAPPSIAWLFNVRGQDVSRSPLPLGRALINKDGSATLFVAPEKIGNDLPGFLGDDVDVRAEDDVASALEKLGKQHMKVAVDPALAPSKYVDDLKANGAVVIDLADPCALPRAAKNETEIAGTRAAHIRDGAAITIFLHWLDTEAQSGEVDEITAAQKLESIRMQSDMLRDLSFDTISGAGPNSALPHYRVSTESNIKLDRNSLYLVDSGGQYPDGTTDIGLLHLVTRGGYSVSGRRHEERVDLLSNGTGPIDDLCHRIVGLDTRPPDSPVRGFLDTLWLDRVLGMALDRPLGTRGPTLRQVLALRPDGLDWSDLRRRCVVGSLVIPGIRPTDANWFDDGSFARWSARLMPDPSEALADLAQLLEEPSLVALTRGIGWAS